MILKRVGGFKEERMAEGEFVFFSEGGVLWGFWAILVRFEFFLVDIFFMRCCVGINVIGCLFF